MAVLGTVLSVAQTLLTALDNSALRKVDSVWSYKSDLDDLKNTVKSVKNILLDAEAKEELSHEAQGYIEQLKDAVYDADDLFDELITFAEWDQQLKTGKLSKKVHKFFSSRNPVKVALRMSTDVKKIRRKLDKIADNHSKFGFNVDNNPIRKRRSETCSYVYAPNIIGREGEANVIVNVLLDTDYEIVTIVGVGGIGKTTLTQLVFNHQRVTEEFGLKLWVCISDQDENDFDVKIILCKILELATGDKIDGDLSLERVQTIFCEKFGGKKYLLVLDDLWNESRNKWTELGKFLKVGARESRIIVTTRSFETATSLGSGYTYPLQGLSDEHSWSLFKITTFDIGPGQVYPPDFVEIGKQIVAKCANVPLVIKVIGSLLYGQDRSKWESFQQSKLRKIRETDMEIMSVLKLSYYNLASPLKSCFSYCAIFPKDEVINKEMLKLHWMALGYVVPFDEGQSLEDAAEEYFLILLRRCFFQLSKKDIYGGSVSFVIHDLMHDVAEHVTINEIFTTNMGNQVRHLFSAGRSCTESSFPKIKVRSCYKAISVQSSLVNTLAANWICLRALTLKLVDTNNLPESIGNLLHLRFLGLSNNEELEMLPDSITKLHNLQTLQLSNCYLLKELPKEFNKLVSLRHLHIHDCRLTCMPPGMDKLTSLCELSEFIVSDESISGMQCVGQLNELSGLLKLRGSLKIQICKNVRTSALRNNCSSLEGAEHLNDVSITFPNTFMIRRLPNALNIGDDQRYRNDAALIENLQLHPNLRELEVCHYSGTKFPMWGRLAGKSESFLPNLVKIKLEYCHQLLHLPPLSKLQYLKSLELGYLVNLEYMDNTSYGTTSRNDSAASGSESLSSVAELSFFPSLEFLELKYLTLKGWWSGLGLADRQPPFLRLSTLEIYKCFNLISFPPCPCLESLVLDDVNDKLKITTGEDHSSLSVPLPCHDHSSVLMSSNTKSTDLKLTVWLNNLYTLPIGRVTTITLCGGAGMETLSQAQEVLKSCSSTLRTLRLSNCELRSLSGGLEHLTALESLAIVSCLQLDLNEDNDMSWRALHQNLRSLKLRNVGCTGKTLPSGLQYLTSLQNLEIQGFTCLESLPEWISFLSALQSLDISHCCKLKSFPDSMKNLTSLQRLDIVRCPALKKIFEDPSVDEWGKIQHVPHFSVIDN